LNNPAQVAELHALLRTNLASFVQRVFFELNPGQEYLHSWHIDAICYRLEQCANGENRRLITTMPPRSLKSISTSVAFVAWMLGRDPTLRFVVVSYADTLAVDLSNQTRAVMESDWYQALFPGTRLSPQKNTQTMFETTAHGSRLATTINGSFTGMGADFIIIDDPIKASEEPSEATLKNAIEKFRGGITTRFNNPAKGVLIVVLQRVHEMDLAGYLLERDDSYTHLNLPAIAEEPHAVPIGAGKFFKRDVGDLLHPERLTEQVLDDFKLQMGPYGFAAQFQQNPAPAGGGIVKWEWFQPYKTPPARQDGDFVVQSWDTAATVKDDASYSVCTTWLCRGGNYFLLDVFRDRLEYPLLEQRVQNLWQEYDTNLVIIEEVTGSLPLIQSLKTKYPKMNAQGLTPVNDKATRMKAETMTLYAGHVFIPHDASWLAEFKREMVRFPNAQYDDQVDSVSQFLLWARTIGPDNPRSHGRQGGKIYFFGERKYF
jgi:predicted phage terminase large subunit-like protein